MPDKRKRKSLAEHAVEEMDEHESSEDTTADASAPKATARPQKTPRPHAEIIEMDSDEEEREKQPRLTGALRGLDPKNMISPTQPSVETEVDDGTDVVEETRPVKHVTRQSRHGRSDVNYDMKYHPADEVMRPKRAAKRCSTSALPEDDVETDEESIPTSARTSNASSDSHCESSDDEVEIIARVPDPKATRHSGRTTTQKAVDYSSKHHPQDFALPGFQHKAKARKKLLKDSRRSVSSTPKPSNLSKVTIDLTKEATDEQSEAEDGAPGSSEKAQVVQRKSQSPRKKLRTLTDSRKRGTGKKANPKKTVAEPSSDLINLLGSANRYTAENDRAGAQPFMGSESGKATVGEWIETLPSSQAAQLRTLTQAYHNFTSTQRPTKQIEKDPAADLPRFADFQSSHSQNARQYDDDDPFMAMFPDAGHPTDDTSEAAGFTNDGPTDIKTHDTGTRRDIHQTQDHPPPSQFDEQLAVTEIRSKSLNQEGSGDPMYGLEAALRDDALRDRDHDRQSTKTHVHNGVATADQSDSGVDDDGESSNANGHNNSSDKTQYDTPHTSHEDANQASGQRSASEKAVISPSNSLAAGLSRPNNALPAKGRSSRAGDVPLPDTDDQLLRIYNSSQRSRFNEMVESDPTSAGNTDQPSDDRTDSE